MRTPLTHDERLAWYGFSRIPGIGKKRMRALQKGFGGLADAWRADEKHLIAAGLTRKSAEAIMQGRRLIDPQRDYDKLIASGIHLLILDDPDYPVNLHPLEDDAPVVLYRRGELIPEDHWSLAVVGTRKSTSYGRDALKAVLQPLIAAGITIVSGLALGIDSIAHRAALDGGGRTIALFGCGLDRIYPTANAALANDILTRGAWLSEYPPGTPPNASHFPHRNRLISGIAMGVLVAEAPAQSGSLITASCAAEQGRTVFAIPGSILSPNSAGTHALIQDGAKLVTSAQDILDELSVDSRPHFIPPKATEIVVDDPLEMAIVTQLRAGEQHLDDLIRGLDVRASEIVTALTFLELQGYVSANNHGIYRLETN